MLLRPGNAGSSTLADYRAVLGAAVSWPGGLRWIVHRTKPSRRRAKNLTAFVEDGGARRQIHGPT